MRRLIGFRLFAVTCLVVLLAASSTQSAFAAYEIIYDDGSDEAAGAQDIGRYLAVRFTPPFLAKLLVARFYKSTKALLDTVAKIHILGSDGVTELTTPFNFDIAANNAWNDVDLRPKGIQVSSDFYIALEYLEAGHPAIGLDRSAPVGGRSYYGTPGNWVTFPREDLMIRAVVDPVLPRVGGVMQSANTLAVLAPYFALIGLVAATAVALKKRR